MGFVYTACGDYHTVVQGKYDVYCSACNHIIRVRSMTELVLAGVYPPDYLSAKEVAALSDADRDELGL